MMPEMPQEHITMHILSDAIGETGDNVARAIASQFPNVDFGTAHDVLLKNSKELRKAVAPHLGDPSHIFIYTFAQGLLHDEMAKLVKEGAIGIDLLGPTVARIERVTGTEASGLVGALRRTDQTYFDRIDAMEFSVTHDDGQHPDGLIHADVVLIGVSRTSKTPLSIYLAYRGLKTANIPLTPGTEPPGELYHCDPRRVYGLMTSSDVLMKVRTARMKELGTWVTDYAVRENIEQELEDARSLMRKLGCVVVNTANRAIEEVAQEILRFVEITEEIIKKQK